MVHWHHCYVRVAFGDGSLAQYWWWHLHQERSPLVSAHIFRSIVATKQDACLIGAQQGHLSRLRSIALNCAPALSHVFHKPKADQQAEGFFLNGRGPRRDDEPGIRIARRAADDVREFGQVVEQRAKAVDRPASHPRRARRRSRHSFGPKQSSGRPLFWEAELGRQSSGEFGSLISSSTGCGPTFSSKRAAHASRGRCPSTPFHSTSAVIIMKHAAS